MKRSKLISVLLIFLIMIAMLACMPSGDDVTSTPGDEVGEVSPTADESGGDGSPGEPAATDTPEPPGCTFDASYVADVTVPDDTEFPPNTPFVKTWRVQNTGTCNLEEGTQLVYVSDDPLGGPPAVDFPPAVPGSNVDVSVNFVSPGTPGTYRSNWQVRTTDGTLIGDQIYVQIVVPEPPPPPTDTPPPTPAPTDTPSAPTYTWHTYSQGDSGPVVYAIQYLLLSEGYTVGVDGVYGPQTAGVVSSFQATEGLDIDGIVGPATWRELVAGHTLAMGSSGDDVRALQHLLRHFYIYNTVIVDGSFGPATDTAVRDFQATAGLVVDGIVGRNTWKALQAD
jgi:peptidoglycan hydrolase-like protein with peptidoglycan-binding domain